MVDNYLKAMGALGIGLGITAIIAFPVVAIGVIVGWFYINESLGTEEE